MAHDSSKVVRSRCARSSSPLAISSIVLLHKLIILLQSPSLPQWWSYFPPCRQLRTGMPTRPVLPPGSHESNAPIGPISTQPNDPGQAKSSSRQEHPVVAHPKNQLCVPLMPRVAFKNVEEGPGTFAILVRHQHPNSTHPVRPFIQVFLHVLLPHHGQEQWSRGPHNRDIW